MVQPRKTHLCLTERLLIGRKESNQTNKQSNQMEVQAKKYHFQLQIWKCHFLVVKAQWSAIDYIHKIFWLSSSWCTIERLKNTRNLGICECLGHVNYEGNTQITLVTVVFFMSYVQAVVEHSLGQNDSIPINYCKFGNFRDNFIFANSF